MKGEVVAVAAAETGGAPIEVDVVTKIDLHGKRKDIRRYALVREFWRIEREHSEKMQNL